MINDLANIAFERIDGDYYWGRYGDFRVIINIQTRYINATQLCKLALSKNGGPKQFGMWRQNVCANEYIDEVSSACGIPQAGLFNVRTTGHLETRGTYAHPDLIPYIASWASPRFAHRVSRIVNEQLVREYRELIRAKDTQIDELSLQVREQTRQIQELLSITRESRDEAKRANGQLGDVKNSLDDTTVKLENMTIDNAHLITEVSIVKNSLDDTTAKLENMTIDNAHLITEVSIVKAVLDDTTVKLENVTIDNTHLITEVKAISTKLKVSVEDRVPKHPNPNLREAFAVYHMPGTLSYKIISRQRISFKIGVKACATAGYTQRIFYSESPNAVNLRARIRDTLPERIGKVVASDITLVADMTSEDLLVIIRAAEAEKRNV